MAEGLINNKLLIIKGILAEKCGLHPDLYEELCDLLDDVRILSEAKEANVKNEYSEREVDFAYLIGVFNVSGIDGLHNEIARLKFLNKDPHDIIIEARNQEPTEINNTDCIRFNPNCYSGICSNCGKSHPLK